jgi:hypothetical protein
MIVPFTIDPDIFFTSPITRDDLVKHKQLIDLWRDLGILVIPGVGKKDSRINKALQNSDQSIRLLWANSLKHCNHVLENGSVDEALKNLEFNKLSSQKIKLWSVDKSKDSYLGLEDASHSTIIKNNEICMFGYEAFTNAFAKAKELSKKPIGPTDDPEKTWKERFLPLCTYSSNIIVCDPWLINKFFGSKGSNLSGIERLIKNLAGINSNKGKILHIFSTNKVGNEEIKYEEIYKKIMSYCEPFKNKSLREVQLYLTTDRKYKPLHYRMFRFDNSHVIPNDSGAEMLGDEGKGKSHDFNLKHLYDNSSTTYKNDLNELKQRIEFNKTINLQTM